MRTNIDIDDDLMAEALEVGGLGTKKATVEAGLKHFIALQKQRSILDLRGKVTFFDDYDYKKMRENHNTLHDLETT